MVALHPLYWIHIGMTLSIFCFYTGFFYRVRNNSLHQKWNLWGTVFNLVSAVYLLYGKYMGGGIESMGIFPQAEAWVIHTHRAFAGLSLVLMLVMAYTGIQKIRKAHVPLSRIFLPLYTVIYLSGLLLFRTSP